MKFADEKTPLRLAMVLGALLVAYCLIAYGAIIGPRAKRHQQEKLFVAAARTRFAVDSRFHDVGFVRDYSDHSNVLLLTGRVDTASDRLALVELIHAMRSNFIVGFSFDVRVGGRK
ncbi:MAG TPA: hypothetical protein VI454_02520 [Verrucomicrobiae bacterium]|jgi:hypothetical protein